MKAIPKTALAAVTSALAFALAAYLLWPQPRQAESEAPTVAPPTPAARPVPVAAEELTVDPDLPLADQRLFLLQRTRDEARDWILRQLESGNDHTTGTDLEVGADQNLTAWPSYRVFLIDLLFQIDPVLAAEKSRELVETSESPDEWAVALRNVAKADPNGSSADWLREKATTLVRNGAWQEDPTSGYLNAFDVVVHTRHTALSPDLMALADDPERKALRHAAFLALDRLVQVAPEEILPTIAGSAARFPQSGRMLANMMARADLRDPRQQEAVASYLLDASRTEDELRSFSSVFPNANFHLSRNLLTNTEGIDGSTLAERDRAALEVVREWLLDERFSRIRGTLAGTEARLARFVESGG